ncbi:malate dehydrogenase-like isoform X3 [Nilaparvata lugens]|uniref:malate dehydrogenase-like isoform X3 n=1 Tax=Nilaparvata lugens TaxID=108931 RepID=UPI00193E0870|nr:malate dehydrogenase-like isoform X3 [Nilaparvata lugens]
MTSLTHMKTPGKVRIITVYGARNPASSLLVMELLLCDSLYERNGLEIRVYDPRPQTLDYLKALVWDLEGVDCSNIHKRRIILAETSDEALKNAELVVVMLESGRRKDERLYSWLLRNYELMAEVAENVDKFCITCPRVVVTCIKPLCFNAHALIKNSRILETTQVVACTNYLGLEILPYLTTATRIPIENIFAPPVWGYIGVNQLVDTCHTKCNYSLWQITSALDVNNQRIDGERKGEVRPPPPPIINEERDLCFRSHSFEYIWRWVGEHKRTTKDIYGCDPYMSQVNSTVEIIKMWFDGDKRPKTEVLSAGILSTGSYGIPKGIVFSQPVFLEDGHWKPYEELELPHFQINLRYLTTLPLIITSKFELCPEVDRLIEPSFFPEKLKAKARKLTLAEQKEMLMKALGIEDKRVTDKNTLTETALEERNLKMLQIKEKLKSLRQDLRIREMQHPTSWYRRALSFTKERTDMKSRDKKKAENSDDESGNDKNSTDSFEMEVEKFMEQLDKDIEDVQPYFESRLSSGNKLSIPVLDENLTKEDLEKLSDADIYKEIFTDYYYRKMLALHDEDNTIVIDQ